NESNESILEAYGLKTKLEDVDKLKPVLCPNCSEQNQIDARFCARCRMILSHDEYMQTVEQRIKEKSQFDKLAAQIAGSEKRHQEQIDRIISIMQENPKLANAKKEILKKI